VFKAFNCPFLPEQVLAEIKAQDLTTAHHLLLSDSIYYVASLLKQANSSKPVADDTEHWVKGLHPSFYNEPVYINMARFRGENCR